MFLGCACHLSVVLLMVTHMSKRLVLPDAVRAIREAKAAHDPDFRVSTFAVKCLMSHGTLINIESGRRKASEEAIERIAGALGVPVSAISYELPESVAS